MDQKSQFSCFKYNSVKNCWRKILSNQTVMLRSVYKISTNDKFRFKKKFLQVNQTHLSSLPRPSLSVWSSTFVDLAPHWSSLTAECVRTAATTYFWQGPFSSDPSSPLSQLHCQQTYLFLDVPSVTGSFADGKKLFVVSFHWQKFYLIEIHSLDN